MAAAKLVTLGAVLALAFPGIANPSSVGAEYRALRARSYHFPDTVPIESRQTDPVRFQCHSDCGNTILDSERDGYCDDPAWRGLFDACLECVGEHPIWQHYAEGVQAAAEGCGLSEEDATPTAVAVASGATTTSGSAPTTAASQTAGVDEQEATTSPTAPSTSASSVEADNSEETGVPAAAARAGGSVLAMAVLAVVVVAL